MPLVPISVGPSDLFYTYSNEFRITHARPVNGTTWEDLDIPFHPSDYASKNYHRFNCHPLRVPANRTRVEIPRSIVLPLLKQLGYEPLIQGASPVSNSTKPKAVRSRMFRVSLSLTGRLGDDISTNVEASTALDALNKVLSLQEGDSPFFLAFVSASINDSRPRATLNVEELDPLTRITTS